MYYDVLECSYCGFCKLKVHLFVDFPQPGAWVVYSTTGKIACNFCSILAAKEDAEILASQGSMAQNIM